MVHLFWSMPRNRIRVSAIAEHFDFSADGNMAAIQKMCNFRTEIDWSKSQGWKKYQTQTTEVEAIDRILGESMPALSKLVVGSMASRHTTKDLMDMLFKDYATDWGGEMMFLRAVLIMLNTRNGVENISVSASPGHDRQRLRAGKLPLFEHRIIKMKLRGPERRRPGSGEHGGMRAHVVRGHFKVRKTGVFYWTPFVRGDPQLGNIRSRYEVSV